VMGPVIDALAGEYEGRVKVLKLNVDENPRTESSRPRFSNQTSLFSWISGRPGADRAR